MSWSGNNRVFKTYIKGSNAGDGKAPGEKVKDRDSIRTFANAANFESFGAVLNPDFVDISFDDPEMSEKFLTMAEDNNWRCLCLQSGNGHVHSYWKDTLHRLPKGGQERKLAVGLIADIHGGSTYIPLRVHGEDRFPPVYDIFDGEDYQEVPDELIPIGKTRISLWAMEDGDGRNEDIFSYILVLQSNLQIGNDEIRRIIRNANKYILKVPLSDSELEVILREDAFQKPAFFMGKTFLFDKFAAFLRNNAHIIRVNNQLHIYRDGVYTSNYAEIENEMIKHIPMLSKARRAEVLAYLEILIRENTPAQEANLIAFENGFLDITDDSFLPFTPDHIVTNKIHWNYNPAAYSEIADHTLNKIACNDPEIRALLEEIIGYCFYRRNELRKAFILIGDKHNGKSTFLSMVQTLLGDSNIAALDLKELNERFKTAELFGKLANIGDDIGDEFIADASKFRKLVTGDRVSVERKGRDPFEFNNYSKFLYSANNIPRIKDKTGAVHDRLIIVPFNATFSKDDPDFRPYIKYELQSAEVMEYLIVLGIRGLKRVMENKAFTVSRKVQWQMDEYEQNNNPILGFFKECELEEFQIVNEPTNIVYKRYREYCLANNFQPISNIEFSKQVKRVLRVKIIDKKICGQKRRIFVKET